MELETLKKSYLVYQKKHKLPSFDELNENFEIEKIERQSDILPRVVRVVMMDKVMATQRFIESLLAPQQAPRMLYKYIKSMSKEDKINLDNLYESFATLMLKSLSLDVEYKEDKECVIIKEIFSTWTSSKKTLHAIISNIQNPSDVEQKKDKSYY
jgi:signal transduction histidine kinase